MGSRRRPRARRRTNEQQREQREQREKVGEKFDDFTAVARQRQMVLTEVDDGATELARSRRRI